MSGLKYLDLDRTRNVTPEILDLLTLDITKGEPYLPHLKFFRITDYDDMGDGDSDVALASFIKSHTGLRELLMEPCKLSACLTETITCYLVNVKRIKFERDVNIPVDSIRSLVDCCPQLDYIAFSNLALVFEDLKNIDFGNGMRYHTTKDPLWHVINKE